MKKPHDIVGAHGRARITWNRDWSEFRVRLNNNPASDYFTNEYQDARETAEYLVNTAPVQANACFHL